MRSMGEERSESSAKSNRSDDAKETKKGKSMIMKKVQVGRPIMIRDIWIHCMRAREIAMG